MDFEKLIADFFPQCPQEEQDQKVILEYIRTFPNILTRENRFAHLTSSSIVLNPARDKMLMVFHNIYQSWAWTGGHADGDSDLLAVAMREAMEETGVKKLRPITTELLSLDILPVWGHVKRGQYVCAHQHLNTTFLLEADETDLLSVKEDENSGVAWIPLAEVSAHTSEPPMRLVYEKMILRAKQFVKGGLVHV